MRSKSDVDLPRVILEKLEAAGAAGLLTSRLPDPKRRKTELAVLEKNRLIGNLGTVKTPRYVLIEHFKPLELAAAHIAAKATPGKAKLWTVSSLTKGSAGAVKAQIRKAIEVLCKEKELITVRGSGSKDSWLHAASVRPLLFDGPDEITESPAPDAVKAVETVDKDACLDAAYGRAQQTEGFADVLIYALWKESGLELPVVHELLISRAKQGQAVLSLGDYLLSPESERGAALPLDGRHYMRVRLQKTGN